MAYKSKIYLFIDESGDPVFYGNRKKLLVGTEGFQPYLIISMIETANRKALRNAVVGFMENIKADSLYNTIPSVSSSKGWYVHARGDHPEIRANFLKRFVVWKVIRPILLLPKKTFLFSTVNTTTIQLSFILMCCITCSMAG